MKELPDTLERLGYAMLNELGLYVRVRSRRTREPQRAKGKAKGKNKVPYAPKTKIPSPPKRDNLAKDSIYHHYKEVGHWRRNFPSYHAELMKRKNASKASTSSIFTIKLYDFSNNTWVYLKNLTTLPKSFWGYALETAARNLNMVPTKKVDRTPYEIWNGKAPKLSYLRVWGCYPKETIGYYFYYPLENKIFVSRNAEFFEISFMIQEASESRGLLELSGSDKGLEIIQEEDTEPSKNTSNEHNEVAPIEVEPQNVGVPIRRSVRIPQLPDRYGYYADVEEYELEDLDEPPNYKAALADPEYDKWLEAINTKMQSIKDNQVWYLVDFPSNGRTVGCKWLFKKKTDMDGNVHTFKAPIRILLSITTFYDYEIWQMDVKTAFLNGHLSEDVYMVQPKGFVDLKHPNKVCKLERSIYRLKQASRSWNKRFDEEIKKIGFTQNPDEPCVYLKASGSNVAFLVLYVDDILLMGNSVTMLQEVKSWLCKCFFMKDLGEAAYILGIKIIRFGMFIQLEKREPTGVTHVYT
ncbi:retrotransposon protein, putative, ty1-copia subclass [Tanacetum coccineum]|uniref:Retrotransposon protein, putative, ty1-copia subclass n=1 Tax=Tanacetum coccineum TaxID=301880 RepID=A0ABQ5FTS0_9ASTR